MKKIAIIIILLNLLNAGVFEEDLEKCNKGNAESCFDIYNTSNKDSKEFIIIGAGVKLRSKMSAKSKKIYISTFGMIVSVLQQDKNKDGETFYKIRVNGKEGWIAKKYIYSFDKDKRGKNFLDISTKKFKNSKSDFGNLIEIRNFLESIIDDDLSTKKELKSLNEKVYEAILEIVKNSDNPRHQKWLKEHKTTLKLFNPKIKKRKFFRFFIVHKVK